MSVYVTFGLVPYNTQLHLISTLCAQINAVDPKGKISSIYYYIKNGGSTAIIHLGNFLMTYDYQLQIMPLFLLLILQKD